MIRKMEEKVKTIYMKPSTEVISMEKAPFVIASMFGDPGTTNNEGNGEIIGGTGGDAKGFFSWTYDEREGIQSDKLTTDWE